MHEPSVFFFGKEQQKFCRNDNWYQIVQYINSKNNFASLAKDLVLDIPNTIQFDSVDEIAVEDLAQFLYPCYLKAAISVSGVGIYRCKHEDELRDALNNFQKNIPIQIQEEVVTDVFLNIQYRVNNYRLERLAVTWGPVLVGKILFMLVGTPENKRELHEELARRLY